MVKKRFLFIGFCLIMMAGFKLAPETATSPRLFKVADFPE